MNLAQKFVQNSELIFKNKKNGYLEAIDPSTKKLLSMTKKDRLFRNRKIGYLETIDSSTSKLLSMTKKTDCLETKRPII